MVARIKTKEQLLRELCERTNNFDNDRVESDKELAKKLRSAII
jgi:hypothetical protein